MSSRNPFRLSSNGHLTIRCVPHSSNVRQAALTLGASVSTLPRRSPLPDCRTAGGDEAGKEVARGDTIYVSLLKPQS